jgi:hypothetical protein
VLEYLLHTFLAFVHWLSVHRMWHMHLVANMLDSSQGICKATTSLGNLWKSYSRICAEQLRTISVTMMTYKDSANIVRQFNSTSSRTTAK